MLRCTFVSETQAEGLFGGSVELEAGPVGAGKVGSFFPAHSLSFHTWNRKKKKKRRPLSYR